MRDLLILLIVVSGSLAALKRPWIGMVMWTWVSLMNPHAEFGYSAANWPVASVVAICTLIGLGITKDRQSPLAGAPMLALLAFMVWTCITLPFSFYFEWCVPLWIRSMKIWLMVFVTLALLTDRNKLQWFIGVMVFSLGFFGVKGGIFTLATGGNFRVWGPGGFIEGNNEIALALVMTIPLTRYLQLQAERTWVRNMLSGVMLLTAVTVLGTYSRGALLALGSMAFFLWLKGRSKVLYGALIVGAALVALPFMPEQWWDRMGTIKTYEQDDSALGRINAWWNAFNVAKANLFGGGFNIYTAEVFAKYSPEPERIHAAHSIYFQVLGEHGFIGLFLFLLIGVATWWTCSTLIRAARKDAELRWAGDLGGMIQVSMIGYATGGAFLSLAYFDLPYNLAVAATAAAILVRRHVKAKEKLPRPVVMPGVPA